MARSRPRVTGPKKAEKGEIVTLKTLISHRMESGHRKDKKTGNRIPRKIINKFECTFNGDPVFKCDLEPAVAANPYLKFTAKVERSGEFLFKWYDDDSSIYKKKAKIQVS